LGANGNLTGAFDLMKNFSFILFPVLTMRMFAEERRLGTEGLLLTAPQLSAARIVIGKFLAASALFLTALLVTLIYVGIIARYGIPNYGSLATSYLGFFLLGLSMTAVCTFAASLAENQITAAITSFGILFFMVIMASFTRSINIPVVTHLLSAIAITTRYDAFTLGILSAGPIVYYLFVTVIALFLAVKSLERRSLD
jgi:ABC-2 type transport system permease protein